MFLVFSMTYGNAKSSVLGLEKVSCSKTVVHSWPVGQQNWWRPLKRGAYCPLILPALDSKAQRQRQNSHDEHTFFINSPSFHAPYKGLGEQDGMKR
jgi:hypothetical protein